MSCSSAFCQSAIFKWGNSFGGSGEDRAQDMTVDNLGNVIVVGYFEGTVDFDPSASVLNKTAVGSKDIFIKRMDSLGNLSWVQTFGSSSSDMALGAAVNNVNEIFICGEFSGTIDFNSGSLVANRTANGSRDAFILKLSSDGTFMWVHTFGGSSWDGARRLSVDQNQNVVVSGWFKGTADFDPDTVAYNLSSSNNSHDAFFAKYSNSGNHIWTKKAGSSGFDVSYGIVTDLNNNVIVTGLFENTVDFNPGTGTANLVSSGNRDGYVLKLDSNGSYLWAKKIGGTGDDSGNFIDVDPLGNIYVNGQFRNTVDFDPGINVTSKTSSGAGDSFVSKYTSSGNFEWVHTVSGTGNDLGQGMKVDLQGNVYATGFFTGTADFDNGSGVSSYTTTSRKGYLVKYNTSGGFVWANVLGGTGASRVKAVNYDSQGFLVTVGWYWNTIDVDATSSGTSLVTSNGAEDSYISKFRVCYPTTSSINVHACDTYMSPSGNLYHSSGVYLDTIANISGCDSIIAITLDLDSSFLDTLNINTCTPYTVPSGDTTYAISGVYVDSLNSSTGCDSVYVINLQVQSNLTNVTSTACDFFVRASGDTVTQSGMYIDTVINQFGCDSIINTNLLIHYSVMDTSVVSSCGSYFWSVNGLTYSTTGIYWDTLLTTNGCDSVVFIDLTIFPVNSSVISEFSCDSLVSPSGTSVWYSSGQYSDTLLNQFGCDSILTINLTIGNQFVQQTIVNCGTLLSPGGNFVMDTTGTYYDTLVTVNSGCDSIIEIQFTNTTSYSSVSQVSCDFVISPSGDSIFNSGTYVDTIFNNVGCDSIITITATILNSTNTTISEVSCGNYTAPDGIIYTSSGHYQAVLVNAVGCDSIVTVNLTVNQPSSSAITTTSCGAYTAPDGTIYSSSGNYTATIVNSVGCDSVINISLTVNNIDTTLTQNGNEIVAVNDANYNYQWVNCDLNVAIPGETNSTYFVTENGNYQVIISNANCVDTSNCVNMIIDNIESVVGSSVNVYPNPAKQFVTILGLTGRTKITVMDVKGIQKYRKETTHSEINIDLRNWERGIYIFKVIGEKQRFTQKVVLN